MSHGIPGLGQFIDPLLRVLREADQQLQRGVLAHRIADRLRLSEEQRAHRLPSGKHLTYRHRTGWALNIAKNAGLVESPEYGMWVLTEPGRRYIDSHPRPVSRKDIKALREQAHAADRDQGEADRSPPEVASQESESVDSGLTPEERIDQAVAELREALIVEVLDLLGQRSPDFFEYAVLDVLYAMGYGISREALQRVGGSGDGGIDGIISLDRLGLEKVYVQAKRWQGSVGRPDIQSFFGALAGRRASKGVFIPTSRYTREAAEYADSVSDRLVLVDGQRLAGLMIDHGVGVTHKPVQIPQLDRDYFEED